MSVRDIWILSFLIIITMCNIVKNCEDFDGWTAVGASLSIITILILTLSYWN